MPSSKNDFLRPVEPISGLMLGNLKLVLEASFGEVRDLDLAMLLNVPVNRIGRLKKANSSVDRSSQRTVSTDDPVIRPNQALLVRLLLKKPHYVPLTQNPTNAEMFELLEPCLRDVSGKAVSKQRFAPLFGRSYVSSYKMLADNESGSLAVVRLHMLITGRFAEIFRDLCNVYVQENESLVPESVKAGLRSDGGWQLLQARDSLTDWMPDSVYQAFSGELTKRWRAWFSENYEGVLRDEAESRNLDPELAVSKGAWLNRGAVDDELLATYPRRAQPILGREDSLLSLFRESFGLTSAEAFWALGLQVKAFYRFRQRSSLRIDAPTSILLRYLFRYPNDIQFLVKTPPDGSDILHSIHKEDPAFRLSQLGPLFGASRVMSYDFAAGGQSCPYFARRLATIFSEQSKRGQPIYQELRACVEDELSARGLNSEKFWQDGRWS